MGILVQNHVHKVYTVILGLQFIYTSTCLWTRFGVDLTDIHTCLCKLLCIFLVHTWVLCTRAATSSILHKHACILCKWNEKHVVLSTPLYMAHACLIKFKLSCTVCTCIHTYIHIYMHTYIHTCISYTAKLSWFSQFFYSTANRFLQIMAIANLSLKIMALLISNVSLQNAKTRVLPWIVISHSKCNSFPHGCFVIYGSYIRTYDHPYKYTDMRTNVVETS